LVVREERVRVEDARKVPVISKVVPGAVLPIPILPADLSKNRSSVKKAISPLEVESVPKLKILEVVLYEIVPSSVRLLPT
jgi:hypothetical protein